jgi:formate dehydrogenase iron-sulfur subunit
MVALWKGIAKPLGLAAVALTALAGFFHYVRVGPNEVSEEDERRAEDMPLDGPDPDGDGRPHVPPGAGPSSPQETRHEQP